MGQQLLSPLLDTIRTTWPRPVCVVLMVCSCQRSGPAAKHTRAGLAKFGGPVHLRRWPRLYFPQKPEYAPELAKYASGSAEILRPLALRAVQLQSARLGRLGFCARVLRSSSAL